VAEGIDEDLEQPRAAQDVRVFGEVVHYLPRDEDDELRPRPGGHDVEAVCAHEELVFVGYRVGVAERVGGDDEVALLALEALDGVHGVPDEVGVFVGESTLSRPAMSPCCARWGVTTPTALFQNSGGE